MAKSARRMRHSARRMHRGGAELSPAPMDGMAAGPAGDAMTEQGLAAEAALVGDNQMPAADWEKQSLEEMGFGAGDANQTGGRKHRSRKHHKRGGKKHSRKTHKRGGKKHSRKHHKRGGKKHSRKHHGKRH